MPPTTFARMVLTLDASGSTYSDLRDHGGERGRLRSRAGLSRRGAAAQTDSETYSERSELFSKIEDYDSAIADANEAIKARPEAGRLRQARPRLTWARAITDEAIADFSHAIWLQARSSPVRLFGTWKRPCEEGQFRTRHRRLRRRPEARPGRSDRLRAARQRIPGQRRLRPRSKGLWRHHRQGRESSEQPLRPGPDLSLARTAPARH